MTTHLINTASNSGSVKNNTGFTDWLWIPFEGAGSAVHARQDSTGGNVTFSVVGVIGGVYDTPFEATANSTDRIYYAGGSASDSFGDIARLDTMSSGWLIHLIMFRVGADPLPTASEYMFSYGQSADSDGFWNIKQNATTLLATFKDANADIYSPGTSSFQPTADSNCMYALAFDMNNRFCHLFAGSTSAALAEPVSGGTGPTFASVDSADLPGLKTKGLAINGRYQTNNFETSTMTGVNRTDGTADEIFLGHHMLIRAENAATKTTADVGELLGDLFDSLPNLPAVMQGWGNS